MDRSRKELFQIFFLILCVSLLKPAFGNADLKPAHDPILQVSQDQHSFSLGPYISYLEDKNKSLTFSDIISNNNFKPLSSDTISFGLTSSAYWLRFKIGLMNKTNKSDHWELIFDPGDAFPGRVQWTLYEGSTGKVLATDHHKHGKGVLIKILQKTKSYYLRVQSNTSLILHPGLYTWKAYMDKNKLVFLFFGLFYGIILVVMIYNIFLGFSFNDTSFFLYALHLLCVILYFFGINGLANEYLLPGKHEFIGLLSRTFIGLMSATAALFTRSFLMTRHKAQNIDKLLLALFIASFSISIINLFVPPLLINTILILLGFLVPFAVILAAWRSYKNMFKPALLFMSAWGLYLLGIVIFSLTVGGMLRYTNPGFYGFQGGAASSALLLSLALRDRIKGLKKEHAAFKESMKRISMILDSIESGIFLVESVTQIIKEINNSAERIIGLNRDKIIGKHYYDFFPYSRQKDRHRTGNDPSDELTEAQLIKANGEVLPVLRRARLIELDGYFLVLTSFVDISELKKTEEALRKSEAKFRSLFESSRDAIIISDWKRIIDCNHAALEMFKCSSTDEMIGKNSEDISPQLQPSGEKSSSAIKKKIADALYSGNSFFEWLARDFSGHEFPVETMMSKVITEGKEALQSVLRDISERKKLEEELRQLATTDPLTGAYNRRSFFEKGDNELLRSQRYNHPLSVLMLDIDLFKEINDTYGHNTGDLVLKELVKQLHLDLRQTDISGRLGGEEFALVLIEADEETAYIIAERLRVNLSNITIDSEKGPVSFAVSIGLSEYDHEKDTHVEQILTRADKALYQAKQDGRNRVVKYSSL